MNLLSKTNLLLLFLCFSWVLVVFSFLQLAVVACIRHACCVVRSLPAEESTRRRTLASSVTLFFFEISVVYQTIAVVITW